MLRFFRRTLHPAWYQGHRQGPPYFEGWYFKLVDATEHHRFAVIPGIFKAADPDEGHAFIQILDGRSGEATYHPYPADAFRAAEQVFDVRIGDSRFTLQGVTLNIDSQDRSLTGQVSLTGLKPWPVRWTSPGVMGWFAWVPLLQTYHGVLSLDHAIHGTLLQDGVTIDFDGGRGYIEKDWGHSFPEAWIWTQTNHFGNGATSLTVSVATIPWLWTSFRGFLIGLWHAGRLFRFTTYTGAHIEELVVHRNKDAVKIVVADGEHRLTLFAQGSARGVLRGPTGRDMLGRVPESLDARVHVRLTARGSGASSLIFEGVGEHAGLEIVGDPEKLAS